MLEEPKKSGSKVLTHMLSSHGGIMFSKGFIVVSHLLILLFDAIGDSIFYLRI